MRSQNRIKSKFKPFMAMFLAFLTAFGAVPLNVLANERVYAPEPSVESEPFYARIDGEDVLVPADGITTVQVAGFREPLEIEIPRYIYLDGEKIPINDDRIENIAPVVTSLAPLSANAHIRAEASPSLGFIVSFGGALPTGPIVSEIGQQYTHPAYVTMNGRIVSSRRYVVRINGIDYEAFCVNPNLPGPETNAAVYELTGADGARFRTVLRYGFPINPALTEGVSDEARAWNVYMTRVAVAYIGNPNVTWGRLVGDTRLAVNNRINGTGGAAAKANSPAITVNGVADASASDDTAQSPPFVLGNSRRTNCYRNPFNFEWAPGTPAGTRLYVDGVFVAAAPANPAAMFSYFPNNDFNPISNFHFVMPQGSEGQTARVNLVGINNRYSGRVFVMQNPNDTQNWQDIVFYIPEVSASAAYTWDYEPDSGNGYENGNDNGNGGNGGTTPPPNESSTSVFIEKVDALSRENIPNATHPGSGALIRLQGMSSMTIVAGDGQSVTFNNTGVNLSQILTATAQIAPPGIPGVTSTVGDGWWRLEGLPYGFYSVVEERAPDGFSLLPQHTAYSFWLHPPDVTIGLNVIETQVVIPWDDVLAMLENLAGANTPAMDLQAVLNIMTSALGAVELVVIPVFDIEQRPHISAVHKIFENYPFSEIIVYKHCRVTNETLADAHIRAQGIFVEGNAPQITDQTLVTDSSGRVVFRGLPAGQFTISEEKAPPGFLLDEPSFRSVSVSWGQIENHPTRPAPVVRFYNTPMSYLEVLKIDGDITGSSPTAGQPLAGARFRLTGNDIHGNRVTWYDVSGSDGIARFEGPFIPGETYLLEEIQSPDGFVLMDGESAIIMTPGRNEVVWRNWRNPGLTILKRCQDTQELLAGAVFSVEFENGQTVSGSPFTTDENGAVHLPWTLFEGQNERTLIVTEQIAPPGFHLSNPNWQRVTMRAGEDNIVTFENRRMPNLTIHKTDAITGVNIQNAEFTIERLSQPGAGMLTGNPFRTDAQGRIVLPDLPAGIYRIIETRAARNYWLDPQLANRTWTIEIRPNEDYLLQVQNTLLPTLVITKMCAVSFRPVPLTHFRVYYEVPNSPNVVVVGNFITNSNGQIILPFVDVGWYRFIETRPAPGMSLATNNSFRVFLSPGQNTYQLMRQGLLPSAEGVIVPDNPHDINPPDIPVQEEQLPPGTINPEGTPIDFDDIEIVNDANIINAVTTNMIVTGGGDWLMGEGVWNFPLNSIVIKKSCSVTGRLLSGATFELVHTSAGVSGTLGSVIGRFTTDASGIIVITGLVPGSYVAREVIPPRNHTLSENNTQTVHLMPDGHSVVEISFANDPYGSLLINKRCEITNRPLGNAEFRVTTSDGAVVGTSNGIFVTNNQGYILIPNLSPNSFVVSEVRAPEGFLLDGTAQTIRVNATGETYSLNFTNRPLSTLIIRKLDSFDNTPLPGARFEVRRQNGELIGQFVTDNHGTVEITGILGWVVVQELEPPPGFALDLNAIRTVEVRPQAPTIVTFYNPRNGSLTIEKTDPSGTPLAGAQFRVSRQNGELIGAFTTPASGIITVPNLQAGWFFVEETRSPQGFLLSQAGQSVEVRPNTAAHVTFINYRKPSIVIEKVDESGNPLANAVFEVRTLAGARVAEVTTNNSGIATVTDLDAASFQIFESRAPEGFVLDSNAQVVTLSGGDIATVRFVNRRIPSLVIEKVDEQGNPLANAEFEVRRLDGGLVSRVVTNTGGTAIVERIEPGSYQILESRAPDGFVLDSAAQIAEIRAGETVTLRFVNRRTPSLIIEKVDEQGNPLANAEFEVRRLDGGLVSRVVTNTGGTAIVDSIVPGSYQILESRAPDGFVLDSSAQIAEIRAGETVTLRFVNRRIPSLIIEKVDEQGNPLANAEFEVRRLDGGLVTRVTSNAGGVAIVERLNPGSFEILESRAPDGFVRDSNSQVIEIVAGQTVTLRFINVRIAETTIRKICGNTSRPLAGVVFEVTGLNGQRVRNPVDRTYEFTTDAAGMIHLSLPAGTYVATEIRPLPGYSIALPQTFEVVNGVNTTVLFRNYKRADWVLRKTCGDTGQPLEGVWFEFARYFGNGNAGQRLQNPVDGSNTFVTDSAGLIHLPNLEPSTFIAIETRALPGFILAEPVIFVVSESAQNTTIDVRNYRQANLTIKKVNSITQAPLENVHFEISRPDGTRVRNPQSGFYTFITDRNGLIHLPVIEDGRFYLRETRALPGFLVDHEIIAFSIDSAARQRDHVLIVENTPASGLLIIKRCANTLQPLQGVEFEVRHADGRLVRGLIADQNQPGTPVNSPNITPAGNFVTDHRGMIHLNHLESGVFHITEVRALPGFILDNTVHVVTITPGRLSTLEVVNEQMAGLRLLKIDSVTRQGIQGVEFRIFDFITSQEVAGPFITDNEGVIDFTGILPAGRFTIRETREAPGYLRDTMPRTIEFRAGMMTEVVWENTREAGQIQITKLSSADNEVNGLPAGSRLAGAVFEVRDWRTGNVVDQFVTDARGVGVSRPLPLGRYRIEEIVAPPFYRRSDVVLDVTIEHSGQILRYEFFNEPANVGVEIRKTGPVEVMSGQPIVWTITTIANSSTIELSDFYVRDILPAHAVRLDRVFTGTFNQSLRYSIMFRTNTNDTWRVAFDNLPSTTNNALVMSPAALGLGSNEFVTEIMYSFGTVRAGFRSVEAPRIEGTVRDGLQNGEEFANRVDIGGRTGTEWVIGNNVWVTRVFRPATGNHPRTGW